MGKVERSTKLADGEIDEGELVGRDLRLFGGGTVEEHVLREKGGCTEVLGDGPADLDSRVLDAVIGISVVEQESENNADGNEGARCVDPCAGNAEF